MNEPIISPWLIYFVSMSSRLADLFMLFTMGLAGLLAFNLVERSDCRSEEERKAFTLRIRLCVILGSIFLLLALAIPAEETVWRMWVASKVTPANIQEASAVTADVAQKALDLITDSAIKIIQEVKK